MAERGSKTIDLTLLSRRDCPLCDALQIGLHQWDAGRGRYTLEIIDVDRDPALKCRYGLRVPVLLHGATELCAGRFGAEARAALDAFAD